MALNHISFSAASLFDQCPAQYRARRILKVPEMNSKPLISGIMTHAVVEKYLSELQQSGLDKYPGGISGLVEAVFAENDRINSTEYYTDVLRTSMAFAKNFVLDPDNVLDMEHRSEMSIGDGFPNLLTFTDLRERLFDDEGPFIGITDFKSGWSSTQTESLNFQLDIEGAQALAEYPGERIMVRNYFVRWNIATKWRKISEWDVNNATARLRAIVTRMEKAYNSRIYPENPGDHCYYCPIAQECKLAQDLSDAKAVIVTLEQGLDRIRKFAVIEAALNQMKKVIGDFVKVNGDLRLDDGYGAGLKRPSPSMTLVGVREAYEALGDDFFKIINLDKKALKNLSDDGRLEGLWTETQGKPRMAFGKSKDEGEEEDE